MAIVKLNKMTISGLTKDKTIILQSLQDMGGAHLIALTEQARISQEEIHEKNKEVLEALKYLNQCPRKRHQVREYDSFDLQRVTRQALQLKELNRELLEQRDFLKNRIKELEPWGDFTFPPLDNLRGIRLWFYKVPTHLMKKIDASLIYQVVHTDNAFSYIVVLSSVEPPANAVPVPRTHTGSVPLSELKKQLYDLELKLEDIQAQRESLTRWITLMSLTLLQFEDKLDLQQAMTMTQDDDSLFILQAWIPDEQRRHYQSLAQKLNLALLLEAPEPQEKPPTLLKNPEPVAAGENIIRFYQIPGYYDWDPSAVVFFSFAVFFAMILSDAGYAMVLTVLLLLNWRKLKRTEKGRRLRYLFLVMVIFSLLWGAASGTYFGVQPPEDSLLSKLVLVNLNDFDRMMKLSIAVGVVHIVLANLIKAWQKRNRRVALSSIGWALLAISGFVFWLNRDRFNENQQMIVFALMGFSLLLVMLFSSDDPHKTGLVRLLEGVKSLAGITRIFSDTLSYLRLFALGLASASLAMTFNQLAHHVLVAVPGVGLFFSIMILIAGHVLNLVLCLMSGVVHGLRLNFIEFYNWSISDEGYPFKAFSHRRRITDA